LRLKCRVTALGGGRQSVVTYGSAFRSLIARVSHSNTTQVRPSPISNTPATASKKGRAAFACVDHARRSNAHRTCAGAMQLRIINRRTNMSLYRSGCESGVLAWETPNKPRARGGEASRRHRTTTSNHNSTAQHTHSSEQAGKTRKLHQQGAPPPGISLPRVRVVHPKLLAECCIHIPVAFSEHLAVKHLDDRVGKLAPNSLRNDAM
jgi:hypothetical protein